MTDPEFSRNAEEIAEAGERLYADQYKRKLEQRHRGEFAVIDIVSGKAYVRRLPEDALQAAREDAPDGVFHLIRIGAPGAFRVS